VNFHGKISYSKCRKFVYTPTGWEPAAVVARSSELPDKRLALEFVYGYAGGFRDPEADIRM
jgi:hypothetical protein